MKDILQDEDIYTFFESETKLSHETRQVSLNVLDLEKENYFSVAIGQTRTKARYVIDSSQDAVDLLHKLAVADTTTTLAETFSDSESYQTCNGNGYLKHSTNGMTNGNGNGYSKHSSDGMTNESQEAEL
ncbi:unnamed protein product [Eruca vesicaria subsp. sativa]|uniref:Uncharacterized protein n=1 Tax=Eruca vesicaria subsp. sativa TaxID=29727 RepID=A0ABC8LCF4_ERUVS|nr:unnamed protein product [Eruca vesicaria subsp. sativa]